MSLCLRSGEYRLSSYIVEKKAPAGKPDMYKKIMALHPKNNGANWLNQNFNNSIFYLL